MTMLNHHRCWYFPSSSSTIMSSVTNMLPYILAITIIFISTSGYYPSDAALMSEFQPEFTDAIENVTVPLGRDATFTCVVRSLGGYRVGWVRADSKAIQAIHTHVITHNPRVSVSHSDHSTWHLHIKNVKEDDRGSFMCQVNTDPMISQISYLEVVIPPDFISEETSGDLMAPEGSTVKLNCNARGHPAANITWKRENGQNITLKTPSGAKTQVSSFEGNILRLHKVSRADMGAYLCIASNGVPPSISKRVLVSVHFHPVIHVPNQLVGAPLGADISLECNVEAYPRSIHFWIKDSGAMIISTDRYEVQEIAKSMFEVKMILIIRKFHRKDAGEFHCIAKNSLGDVDSIIKLHELKVSGPENENSYRDPDEDDEDDEDEDVDDEYEDNYDHRTNIDLRRNNPSLGNNRNPYDRTNTISNTIITNPVGGNRQAAGGDKNTKYQLGSSNNNNSNNNNKARSQRPSAPTNVVVPINGGKSTIGGGHVRVISNSATIMSFISGRILIFSILIITLSIFLN